MEVAANGEDDLLRQSLHDNEESRCKPRCKNAPYRGNFFLLTLGRCFGSRLVDGNVVNGCVAGFFTVTANTLFGETSQLFHDGEAVLILLEVNGWEEDS